VLETLHREIARGDVVTYGRLAERAGHPGAARAVGTACARNPIPLIVPCHRVVPGSGGIGGYGGGPERKRVLLELEGALTPRLGG
jgi:methylated-DNA-[protein]-cysteine S-methyltransferase